MKKERIRFFIVIALTLLTAGFIAKTGYEPPLENRKFFDFPMAIDGWKGEEVPMAGYVYQSLETRYFFLRNYYSDKNTQPINLSIVWFDDRNIAFHAPEACLGGVGVNILDKKIIRADINGSGHWIVELIVDFNGVKQLVLYYFDVEGKITTSQSVIRWTVFLRKLAFRRTSAAFIRLMTPLESDNDKAQATKRLISFINAVQSELPQYAYTDNAAKR
jgi:EpsI family protein